MAASSRPGRIPPANSAATLSPVTEEYRMNIRLGGMSMASAPDAAAEPLANAGL